MTSSFTTKRKKKHMKHVQQIFQKLQKAGLQLDIDKCEFFVKEVKYLNLIITPESIKMDQKKLSAVFDWSIPENLKNIRSYLGFANFYKRFIRDFSKIAAPLNALVKKTFFFIGALNNKKLSTISKSHSPRHPFCYITIQTSKQW